MYIKKTDNPNMGRPSKDPKCVRIEVRLTESEAALLKACADTLGITRTDTINKGIKLLYSEIQTTQGIE